MPKKILLAEDNEHNRLLLKDVLTFHGYAVLEATDGARAVDLARRQTADLILMDIQMSVMDGFTAGKLLKEDPATRHIPLVALTSFAMVGDRERILAAGFDDYLAKPIDTRQLPELIKKFLALKQE